jgi:hypothetical protein
MRLTELATRLWPHSQGSLPTLRRNLRSFFVIEKTVARSLTGSKQVAMSPFATAMQKTAFGRLGSAGKPSTSGLIYHLKTSARQFRKSTASR